MKKISTYFQFQFQRDIGIIFRQDSRVLRIGRIITHNNGLANLNHLYISVSDIFLSRDGVKISVK